jgi:hypothetical protein
MPPNRDGIEHRAGAVSKRRPMADRNARVGSRDAAHREQSLVMVKPAAPGQLGGARNLQRSD